MMNRPTTPSPIKFTQWCDTSIMVDDPADFLGSDTPKAVIVSMRRNILRLLRSDGRWRAAQRLAILWGL